MLREKTKGKIRIQMIQIELINTDNKNLRN